MKKRRRRGGRKRLGGWTCERLPCVSTTGGLTTFRYIVGRTSDIIDDVRKVEHTFASHSTGRHLFQMRPLMSARHQVPQPPGPSHRESHSTRRNVLLLLSALSTPLVPTKSFAATATALFSAGDPRYLQTIFLKRKGAVLSVVPGSINNVRSIRVEYDASKITYKELLGLFWRNVDPTDDAGQFKDRGPENRPIVWVANGDERSLAERSRGMIEASKVYGNGVPRSSVKLRVEIAESEPFVEDADPMPGFDSDSAYSVATKSSGREKFFLAHFNPIKTTACEGTVCGYVYFPCTPENGCLDVVNGIF